VTPAASSPAVATRMRACVGDSLRPEAELAAALRAGGLRFARNARGLPGSPDFVVRGAMVAVFVNGCFWHRCPKHYREPATNAAWWREKMRRNVARDRRAARALRAMGYRVLTVWEHDLRDGGAGAAARVARAAAREASDG
jgi:DNA mismatch endonuclease, patch repair protein